VFEKNEMAPEVNERAGRAVPNTAGMERVLDFEMPVRISIARTTVPLREVLRLSTGSVLELNRSLDDLVDLVVNNRVVAQGEIVVVEGNYGIRIHRVNDQARDQASQAEIRS
jgi:flagellar motor switch protein FliN/FliY